MSIEATGIIRTDRLPTIHNRGMLFDTYLFADYSGARCRSTQRRAIRLAQAGADQPPALIGKRFTREELVSEFVSRLQDATRSKIRVCFGQDHQYGIPVGLGRELGLEDRSWRQVIEVLCTGTYAPNAPALDHASTFASAFNAWLKSKERLPYFYSATKAQQYKIPSQDPRAGDRSTYRLTERCRPSLRAAKPKPFNRVGDNGTVGGQTLVGIIALRELLAKCERVGIPVAVWPFDGLSIGDSGYAGKHVLIEPYPTAVREAHVPQTDESDALASAGFVLAADRDGNLGMLLDLSELDPVEAREVRFEGWILSHEARRR